MELKKYKEKAIDRIMEENEMDILVASTPYNIYYLSNYMSTGQRILSNTEIYAIYERGNDNKYLVLPYAEIPGAQEQVNGAYNLYTYGEFYFNFNSAQEKRSFENVKLFKTAAEALEAVLSDSLSGGKIGIDETNIPPTTWEKIIATDKNFEFVKASEYLGFARMIKHPDEIKLLEKAAKIVEKTIEFLFSKVQPGMSEKELEKIFIQEIVKQGALPHFNVITIDARSAFSDTINTNYNRIKEDSLIRIDAGCEYKQYKADIARTIVIGKATTKIENYYNAIVEGKEAAVEKIKPGVLASEIYAIALEKTNERIEHFKRNHCGHGIGLNTYDPPLIAPDIDIKLSPGMVLCIETPYYEIGWKGLQVEDTVVVTDSGSRYLTKCSSNLRKY